MRIALLILGGLALGLYIPEKIRGYTVKAVFLKSVVSLLFVAVAVAAGTTAALGPFVILGLVCGLLGDVWLDLKYVFPAEDRAFTYAGFCAFGVGHILYITGLLLQYGAGLFLLGSFGLAALVAGLVALLEKPMKLRYGSMKPIVLCYSFLLFSLVSVSGGLLLTQGGTALLLLFIGSVLFAISDLILSGTYFGTGRERPIDLIGNYLFYYGGQFLIAFAVGVVRG